MMDTGLSMAFDNQQDEDANSDRDARENRRESNSNSADEFEAAVELDESLLNFPATGVDSMVMNSDARFYNRVKPKKAFSLMKFKKRLHKDTSLLFDEQPQQAMLPKDAFDFCKVEDVTDCQE